MLVSRFAEGVTKRHCQSVRRIKRLWFLLQIQQLAYHQLHLFLIRLPVADNSLFDLQGGVFCEGDTCLSSGQNDNAARLAEQKCALNVRMMEDLLDDYRLRHVTRKELL